MPRRRGRGLDCTRRHAAVCLASLRRSRASQISAQQRFRRQLFAKPASADLPFSPALWQGRFRPASGLMPGRRRFSPIKFFLTKNPLPRRSTRPNAPVGSVPAGDIAVRATRCSHLPGEQPTLGASKIMVCCLHRYSLINLGRCLILSVDLFRLLANYIQNE